MVHTAKTLGQLAVTKFKTNSEGIIWLPFCSSVVGSTPKNWHHTVCMHAQW